MKRDAGKMSHHASTVRNRLARFLYPSSKPE